MADRPVEIRYKGREFRRGELADIVKELPRRMRAPAMLRVAKFYQRKFRLYPRYKYVTRYRAYGMQAGGRGWFSHKQRRYVMMLIKKGIITPGRSNRTGETKRAWLVEGKGVKVELVNRAPAAVHLYDNKWQARQPGLVGWKKVDDMLKEYEPAAIEDLWEYAIELADKYLEDVMTGRKK